MRPMHRLLAFLSLLLAFQAAGQHAISGLVADEAGAPIPYANVALHLAADSALVQGTATDINGAFSLQAEPGRYYLRVTFLSYAPALVSGVTVANNPVPLGTITLKENMVSLDAVDITAERSTVELKLDKRVFNVGKDLANSGATASEVLDNVPSVTVDVEGNVSLRGSQAVRILIDGNPSGLIGNSPAAALRQLPANTIERVEVITNPSARYDAEGEVGIINIVLKKEKRKGINGSIDASAGWPHDHAFAFNLNLRIKKFNLFASAGVNYRKSPGGGWYNTTYTGDSAYYFETTREHARGGFGQNFRLGSDFFLSKHNTLTVSGVFSNSRGLNDARVVFEDFNNERVLTQTVVRTEEEEEIRQTREVNLNHSKTFAEKDREWSTQFRYYERLDNELADLAQQSSNDASDLLQRTSNREDEQSFLFQTDYVDPFGNDGKWETGVKATLRTINNDYLVETRPNEASGWTVYRDFDNALEYIENIYAAYAMAGNEVGRFSWQGGLRLEYTDIRTELKKTNETNPRSFLNLFPSAHLGYELDSLNTLQLSYSRRVSRPGFWNLIPFTGFSDNRTFRSGNPDLNPEFTHSVEAGHLFRNKGTSLLSSVYYRYRAGAIYRIMLPDSTGFTRFYPINLDRNWSIGWESNINLEPADWLKLNAFINLYYVNSYGTYEELELAAEAFSMTARGSAKLSVSPTTDAQISYDYRAPRNSPQGFARSMTAIHLAASRKLMRNKATLTFSVRDLLNTRKRRAEVTTDVFYQEGEYQWRSRQLVLSFNYRIDDGGNGGSGKRPQRR